MYKKYFKRPMDILFSSILIVLTFPIILICGVLIKLEDGGTIFYCGDRLGKNGRIFKMYKLRTMKVNSPDLRNSDGSTFNADNDPRLTKIGGLLRKTSLDELPQLFNVLIGDMSLVGPRPDLPEHLSYYDKHEIGKLEVLPGITGYNQAFFRNSEIWKKRLENDVFYTRNISLVFDLKILFRTIIGVVFRKGIYSNSEKA